MRYARIIFIIVILVCVAESARLWFLAPSEMASHFNAQGSPDNFVSKFVFFEQEAKTFLTVLVVSFMTQVLPMVLPVELINMPNRDYWLSPEKREETIDRLSSFGAALFTVILLVIQFGFELAVSANLQDPIMFSAQKMIMAIIVMMVLSIAMLFWLANTFRVPA